MRGETSGGTKGALLYFMSHVVHGSADLRFRDRSGEVRAQGAGKAGHV